MPVSAYAVKVLRVAAGAYGHGMHWLQLQRSARKHVERVIGRIQQQLGIKRERPRAGIVADVELRHCGVHFAVIGLAHP